MTTTAVHSGQVTVTVTSAPDGTNAATTDTSSSTLSLIYIYSTSTSSQPTEASSSNNNHNNHNASHVSGGMIAGIVVSCIAFLVLLSLALFCYSRRVARKRRAEMHSLHSSRHPTPSRAYSHMTTAQGTMDEQKSDRSSQYTQSVGALSAGTGTKTMSRKFISPSPMPSIPPAAELPTPTPHNASMVRVVNVRKPRPDVAEMYGSSAHPAELQAPSRTNLVSVKAEKKQRKASDGERRGTHRDRGDSDVESRSHMRPAPDWHSRGRRGSDGAETEYGTEYGTVDGGSIHIYYRSSAATIAQAMSQASLTKASSTMRSGSPRFLSQTSLITDSTR